MKTSDAHKKFCHEEQPTLLLSGRRLVYGCRVTWVGRSVGENQLSVFVVDDYRTVVGDFLSQNVF